MNASTFPTLRLLGAVSILAFAASAAMAQSASDSQAPAPANQGAPKTAQSGEKKVTPTPPKAAGYATEGEARSHCKGSVVWVDKDHFNHYAGSREYGKKPGNFACE